MYLELFESIKEEGSHREGEYLGYIAYVDEELEIEVEDEEIFSKIEPLLEDELSYKDENGKKMKAQMGTNTYFQILAQKLPSQGIKAIPVEGNPFGDDEELNDQDIEEDWDQED